jgi:hypothetical protein
VKRLEGQYVGIFVPDGRTLVVGTEDQIKALFDRLKQGKAGVEPPPGWQEVNRDLIAGALDQRQRPCVTGKWPDEPAEAKNIGVLFETLNVSAFGVVMQEAPAGGHLVGRLVGTAKNAASAERAAEAIKAQVAVIRTLLARIDPKAPTAPAVRMVNEMFDHATLSREGPTVRGSIAVPFALIRLFLTAARQTEATPPANPPPSP